MPKRPSSDLPELAERLIEVRQQFDLNQRDFAERLGVSWRALQDYEQGRAVPGGNVLAAYAELGVDLNWLLIGEKAEKSQGQQDFIHDGFVPVRDLSAANQSRFPVMLLNRDVLRRLMAAASDHGAPLPEALGVASMRDDSMEPTIGAGSLVLTDVSINQVDGDGLYVLGGGPGGIIRRVQVHHDGTVLLRCDNPRHPCDYVSRERADKLQVLGRVLIGVARAG